MAKILIIEDEPIIMQDISDFLDSLGYVICGKAYTPKRALELLDNRIADLVLLDINLNSDMDGIEMAKVINEKYKIPFIFLTSYADQSTLARVMSTRPAGYVVKPFEQKDIYAAVELAISRNGQSGKPNRDWTQDKMTDTFQSRLTKKEIKILWNLYQGNTNREISVNHFISANTVKSHVKNIYAKLEVHSRQGLMVKLREMNKS